MRNPTVLTLLFANAHDEALPALTAVRPMGSVPFGGRYRLIDFALSNAVNAGIATVGVLTQNHYQSLMDHIGSGKAWDLSRKNEGLYFLPSPTLTNAEYAGRIAPLLGIRSFLHIVKEDLVVLADCHLAGTIDYSRLLRFHNERGADITLAYQRGPMPPLKRRLSLELDASGGIQGLDIGGPAGVEGCYSLGIYVLSKALLLKLLESAASRNLHDFDRDVLMGYRRDLRLCGYEVPEEVRVMSSPLAYVEAHRALFDAEVRQRLFGTGRPVYTKVRDAAPAVYGLHAQVTDSLVADGCYVEGTVRRSILFRDVRIARHAVVEDCIVMQGTVISENARLSHMVLDKNVVVQGDRALSGAPSYPLFIDKGSVV